jgi:hypothetical protein
MQENEELKKMEEKVINLEGEVKMKKMEVTKK